MSTSPLFRLCDQLVSDSFQTNIPFGHICARYERYSPLGFLFRDGLVVCYSSRCVPWFVDLMICVAPHRSRVHAVPKKTPNKLSASWKSELWNSRWKSNVATSLHSSTRTWISGAMESGIWYYREVMTTVFESNAPGRRSASPSNLRRHQEA